MAAIIEAGETIAGGIALKFLVFVVLDHHRNAHEVSGAENIDERGLEHDAAAQRFGEFALAGERLRPGIEALRLGQIDLRGSLEKTL